MFFESHLQSRGFNSHVTCGAVVAPVGFDNLAPVTVADGYTESISNHYYYYYCINHHYYYYIVCQTLFDSIVQDCDGNCLTSGAGARVERKTARHSLQDLLLGLWTLFFLIKLLLSFG